MLRYLSMKTTLLLVCVLLSETYMGAKVAVCKMVNFFFKSSSEPTVAEQKHKAKRTLIGSRHLKVSVNCYSFYQYVVTVLSFVAVNKKHLSLKEVMFHSCIETVLCNTLCTVMPCPLANIWCTEGFSVVMVIYMQVKVDSKHVACQAGKLYDAFFVLVEIKQAVVSAVGEGHRHKRIVLSLLPVMMTSPS